MSSTPRRALLVIDVQNEYLDGGLPIDFPGTRRSLPNIARAMDSARIASVPVVVVQNSAPAASPLFAKGSAGWALHREVANRHRDHYIEKSLPSAFHGTDLASWLESRSIDTLTLTGYMTHNCVAATAFEALHRGLAVEVLSDATGSVPYSNAAGHVSAREIHQAFCVVLQSRFAAVAPTDAWIAALRSGAPLPRDTIAVSNRRARALEAAQ